MQADYNDRTCSARETVERMRQHMPALGITRVGRQTGLDRIGIASFAAFRPNAKSLSISQGKGLDDDSAIASALMEAVELATAEALQFKTVHCAATDLPADAKIFDPSRMLPMGASLERTKKLYWVRGENILSGESVFVPRDCVSMDWSATELVGIAQSSNGLASGNRQDEAIFHALCELIERDATSLYSLLPPDLQCRMAVKPSAFNDPGVDELVNRVEACGLRVMLFEQTTDLGIVCVMALIGGLEERHTWFEQAAGYGAHPVAARAAIRAITEAAQTRITSIASARDDVAPSTYKRFASMSFTELMNAIPRSRLGNQGIAKGAPLSVLLDHTCAALRHVGIDQAVAVPLTKPTDDFSVVKVLVPALEDREPNKNWRPGTRAVSVLYDLQCA